MKILIVEDDENIFIELKKELVSFGYEVSGISNFNNIVEEFLEFKPHLILMDIILPYNNGYFWCEEIRKLSNVPVIFISSRSENIDIVMAMQFGGDDYITKPFDLGVALAKIRAMLRRTYDFTNVIDSLNFKDVYLFLDESKLKFLGEEINLSRTELIILEVLFKAKGSVASREIIMEKCWNGDDYIDDNTLAVNITRLRKKLSSIGLENFILTKKKLGYYLDRG